MKCLKESLKKANWDRVMHSKNPTKEFYAIFKPLLNKSCPLKLPKPNKQYTPIKDWMSKEILAERRKKLGFWKEWQRTQQPKDRDAFKTQKNHVNSLIRKAQKKYLDEKIQENYANGRKLWEIVNAFINRKQKIGNSIDYIISHDEKITNRKKIAQEFNDFFSTVGSTLAKKMEHRDIDTLLPETKHTKMTFETVTEESVLKIVQGLKNKHSTGFDDISNKLLKEIMPEVLKPLTHVINMAIEKKEFPNELKIAKVVPIFKNKGENADTGSYRPISLLPTISKVLEKIMNHQITEYMTSNNYWTPNQFGFRKNHETNHAVIQAINYIVKAKKAKNNCLAVFMDLKKAFDTVNHARLLLKMEKYGIDSQLMKSYLNQRQQFVQLGEDKSTRQHISCGVPQGSILGPTLFLIYINDISNSIPDQDILLFADDTSIIFKEKTHEKLIETTNIGLKKLHEWFLCNKLTVHPQKSNFMAFLEKNPTHYDKKILLNDHALERIGKNCAEETVKYVGIYIDEHLNFNNHAKHVCKKSHKTYT